MGSFSSMTAIATNLPEVADRDYKSQSNTKRGLEEDNGEQIRGSGGDASPLEKGEKKGRGSKNVLFIRHSNIKLA